MDTKEHTDRVTRVVHWGLWLLASAAHGVLWATVTLGRAWNLAGQRSARALDSHLVTLDVAAALGAAAGGLAWWAWGRRRTLSAPPLWAAGLLSVSTAAGLAWRVGGFRIAMLAWVFGALVLSALLGATLGRSARVRIALGRVWVWRPLPWLLALTAACSYAFFSLSRHWAFGSGSWDLGCYTHNVWLIAHGKPWVSTVLGDVNFIGDHFVPVLVLLAPLGYAGRYGAEALLIAQALAVASAALPLVWLADARDVPRSASLAVAFAYLFAVGTQSMINFDVHEIMLVPAALVWAHWAIARESRKVLYVALLIVATSKESAILYAGGIGGYLALFAPRRRLEGLGIVAASVALFITAVSWLQPKLLEGGPQGMIHLARFADFGDSATSAVMHMARHPGKMLLALFAPLQKLQTHEITFGGTGFLAAGAPDIVLSAFPNFMERFLSNKREMWGLGFHYSVVLAAVTAVATVLSLARLRTWLEGQETRLPRGLQASRMMPLAGVFVLVCTVGSWTVAPGGAEFRSVRKPYFSSAEKAAIYRRALAVIPAGGKVVAQNHFLPYLAGRQYIWQPHARFLKRADWVMLDPAQSAWPHSPAHVKRLVQQLRRDAGWKLVFSEGTTFVWSRVKKV